MLQLDGRTVSAQPYLIWIRSQNNRLAKVRKVAIYIYLNNHLQVKVRWDFNKKSTTRLFSQRAPP